MRAPDSPEASSPPSPSASPSPATEPLKPAASPRTFSLLAVIGIALTTFMFGLYAGSTFLGTPAPPPPPQTAELPTGHPAVDPNAPVPAPPLPTEPTAGGNAGTTAPTAAPPSDAAPSGNPAPASAPAPKSNAAPTGGPDLAFDDPAVRKAIESTDDYKTLVRIGNEQFDLKHPKLAVAAYEKALKIHPFDADVQTDLGTMYRAMHRHDDALNAFRKAASMDAKHHQSRYNIGVVLAADHQDLPGAIAAWKEYLKVAPPGPHAEEVKRRIATLEQSLKKPKGS